MAGALVSLVAGWGLKAEQGIESGLEQGLEKGDSDR